MDSVLSYTESLCPVCLKKIPAVYIEENDNVYLKKNCAEHGFYKTLVWRDAGLYRRWQLQSVHAEKCANNREPFKGCPFDCGLCSEHEGGTCTAVLELTYRCNMNCSVCFADTDKESFESDLNDIREMYTTILNNGGPCSVQLSGGEPTVRDDLPGIIEMGKGMGFEHIQVNTNGIRIAEDTSYLEHLKKSGADLIYLQFDGLSDDVYEVIRGKKMLNIKMKAIENCRKVNLAVLLVPTIIPKINFDQIGGIINYAKEQMPVVKGIHFQPVSYFGRFPLRNPRDNDRITLADIMKGIEVQTQKEITLDNFIPRKRFDSHCAFSGLFYLQENDRLQAITENSNNDSIKDTTQIDFVGNANKYTNKHWKLAGKPPQQDAVSKLGRFAKRLKDYTLSITGMPFQDVWNVDLNRLKGCCVHVISNKKQVIPLCAFHITSADGKRLYRNE